MTEEVLLDMSDAEVEDLLKPLGIGVARAVVIHLRKLKGLLV